MGSVVFFYVAKFVERFKLNDNGIILTYFYKVQDHIREFFCDKEIEFDKIGESEANVMIYSKKNKS